MRTRPTIIFYSPVGRAIPDLVARWVNGRGFQVLACREAAAVEQIVLRSLPLLVLVDADAAGPEGLQLCERLKGDPYMAIVPVAAVAGRHATDRVGAWFAAGADEVITPLFEPAEHVEHGPLEHGLKRRRDGLVSARQRLIVPPGGAEQILEPRREHAVDRGLPVIPRHLDTL